MSTGIGQPQPGRLENCERLLAEIDSRKERTEADFNMFRFHLEWAVYEIRRLQKMIARMSQ